MEVESAATEKAAATAEPQEITLEDLLSNPNFKLKILVKSSLYSYVFIFTNPKTREKYIFKLIPIGHLLTDAATHTSSQQSQDAPAHGIPIPKKITPKPRRVEKEFENLQYFHTQIPDTSPKPESFGFTGDAYTALIERLKGAAADQPTITILDEIQFLLDKLEEKGFHNVQLGWIIMQYIPGQTLWEIITDIRAKHGQRVSLHERVDYRAIHMIAIKQIVQALMAGALLDDAHQGNMVATNKPTKTELEFIEAALKQAPNSRELQFLTKYNITTKIIDLGKVSRRTTLDTFHESQKEFVDSVIKRVARALWEIYDEDEAGWKNEQEFESEVKKYQTFIDRLIKTNTTISLDQIENIDQLRIVLAILIKSNPQNSWIAEFISDNDFANLELM
jgi:hypothetical protein